MITIAYGDLMATVIALALVAIAVAVVHAARRIARTMRQYERLAPQIERLSSHTDLLVDHLGQTAEDLRRAAARSRTTSRNGAAGGVDQVDAALSMIRQLSALGLGLKSAMDAYQESRSQ